jgi:AcrR family transcriptional regulator
MTSETRPYHHGDLRSALVQAGVQLARSGGAQALGLRELTRQVGVTPNAAYRHFADHRALLLAVALEAQEHLAEEMRKQMNTIRDDADPADRALHRLRAVGTGYIHFALAEPGWFELAILNPPERGDEAAPPPSIDDRVPVPFQLLLDALDEMVTAGLLTAAQRENAEWACWSTVHGLADLATRGPLRHQDPKVIDRLAGHVVDTVIQGLRG